MKAPNVSVRRCVLQAVDHTRGPLAFAIGEGRECREHGAWTVKVICRLFGVSRTVSRWSWRQSVTHRETAHSRVNTHSCATIFQHAANGHCRLDRRKYATGRTVTKAEMAQVNLHPQRFHGEWNYVIRPRAQPVTT
jgi:hypothetical protein